MAATGDEAVSLEQLKSLYDEIAAGSLKSSYVQPYKKGDYIYVDTFWGAVTYTTLKNENTVTFIIPVASPISSTVTGCKVTMENGSLTATSAFGSAPIQSLSAIRILGNNIEGLARTKNLGPTEITEDQMNNAYFCIIVGGLYIELT